MPRHKAKKRRNAPRRASYRIVRKNKPRARRRNAPRTRRRNSLTLARGRRAPAGRMWVTRRGKTAIPGGFIGQGATRLNPRRRRRNRSKRRSNPIRRRRNYGRRKNYGRRHRRRNPAVVVYRKKHRRRRNPGNRFVDAFKDLFSLDTVVKVSSAFTGLSLSLLVPKMLGKKWPQLQRGFGGVAVAGTTAILTGALVGIVAPRAGKALTLGGLIGALAGLVSALSCDVRKKILPVEEALLMCALPTVPATGTPQPGLPAQFNQPAPMQGVRDYLHAPARRAALRDFAKGPSGKYRQGARNNMSGRMLDYMHTTPIAPQGGSGNGGTGTKNRWSTVESFS